MYTTVFGKKSHVLHVSLWFQSLMFMSPSAHFALSHKMNVVDTVRQLRVLVNRNHVVSIIALDLPRSQELLFLSFSPGPRSLLSVPQSLPLSSPSLGHGALPGQLQNTRFLFVHAAAVTRIQAQGAVLQLDVSDAPSPAIHNCVDLRHGHIHAGLQRAAAHRHPNERQVTLHRAQLHEVVGIYPRDGEVEVLQVERIVQNRRHASPVLIGQTDDVSGDATLADGEFHALPKDGATRGEDFLAL